MPAARGHARRAGMLVAVAAPRCRSAVRASQIRDYPCVRAILRSAITHDLVLIWR